MDLSAVLRAIVNRACADSATKRLAERSGVSAQEINRLLAGEDHLTLGDVSKLADCLGLQLVQEIHWTAYIDRLWAQQSDQKWKEYAEDAWHADTEDAWNEYADDAWATALEDGWEEAQYDEWATVEYRRWVQEENPQWAAEEYDHWKKQEFPAWQRKARAEFEAAERTRLAALHWVKVIDD